MQTINAIYENGQFILLEEPLFTKSKVKITFYDEVNEELESELPIYKLGKVNDDISEMYDEFLSTRF